MMKRDLNWKALLGVGITAAVAVGAIGLYKLFNEEEEEETKKGVAQTPVASTQISSHPATIATTSAVSPMEAYGNKEIKIPKFEAISGEEMAKHINVLFDEDAIDMSTISQILEKSTELAKERYVKLTLENRKKRRSLFRSDKETYVNLVIEFLEETENVINDSTDEILGHLNIPKTTFEESCMLMMERGMYQQMMVLQASVRQKIKEFIPSGKKPLTIGDIKPILRHQLSILRDHPEFFNELIEKLKKDMETAQLIPLGINVILADLIYDKFECEEEDQMKALKDPHALMQDQEFYGLLMQSEQMIQSMLTGMGLMAGMPGDEGGFGGLY